MRPQRSLRLEKRSTKSLDTLSGASGEIFYDADNATLRMYTTNAGQNIKMATQEWVSSALGVQGANIEYANILGRPTALSAFTNDTGFITSESGGITSDDIVWEVYPTIEDLPEPGPPTINIAVGIVTLFLLCSAIIFDTSLTLISNPLGNAPSTFSFTLSIAGLPVKIL